MQRVLFNFYLALDGVMDNRLRAVLTALGIVFGVAAVIAMLAIGTGAKIEILERMKLIGTNNIEITALEKLAEGTEEDSGESGSDNSGTIRDDDNKKPYSPGLTLKDARAIMKVIPTVENVSPEVVMPVTVIQSGLLKKANCVGVTNAFFDFNNLFLEGGNYFHPKHFEEGRPVCVIGNNIKTKFFSKKEPIGEQIKCGENWLTIIGVLGKRKASRKNLEELGIRDYNADIYIPIETALLRYENRGAITAEKVNSRRNNNEDKKDENYHQLDRLVVRVDNSDDLISTAGIVGRMLKRRHRNLRDFQVEVPELLLEQQQKTQNTFNVVLAVIAGISLLVGGIGIMNIMLATVLERIKEIGVRRSLGATRQDIVLQFLFESIFMSLIGGLIGIILGVAAAELIAGYAEIPTIVSNWSIVLSFGVAATVGLVFGIIPARRAAFLDPIKALRND